MKKYLVSILIIIILVGALSGCGASDNKPSSADYVFVKPQNYAAIVNVEINPSFDIYLDEKINILAIEPKNEDAKTIDFSSYIGIKLTTAIGDLVNAVCKDVAIDRETVAKVKFIEGDKNILEVDVVEIINDACADTVAKETVNESMDSVLQVRLEDEFGCHCMDCNNWYERHWYCYPESRLDCPREVYEQYMENWKKGIDSMNKNDPLYNLAVENYENMTYDKFDYKDFKRQQFYMNYEGMYGKATHKEMNITYKILETVSNANGTHVKNTEELSAEEYFERYPEEREEKKGLEKVIQVQVKVYINGVEQDDYYSGILYLCDGKWYSNNGISWSFG